MTNFTPQFDIGIDEGVSLYKSQMDAALRSLSTKSFVVSAPPTYPTTTGQEVYRGELPPDLTTLTDDQLGYYMGMLSEWNSYVHFQLAEADSQLSAAKSQIALVEASLRMSYKFDDEGKKRSNPERDDCVGIDRRYIEANSGVLYWETMFRYIKAISAGAERSFGAISRRITQRGQELERSRRDGNINPGNIPKGPVFRR